MLAKRDTGGAALQREESSLIDGLVYQGIDGLASRRAHMRELTTARQAVEEHYRQAATAQRDHAVPLLEAREGAVQLRLELTRIDTLHRTWLNEQGGDVAHRRTRRHKVQETAPQ